MMVSIIITNPLFERGTYLRSGADPKMLFMLRAGQVYLVPEEAARVLVKTGEARMYGGSYWGIAYKSMELAA